MKINVLLRRHVSLSRLKCNAVPTQCISIPTQCNAVPTRVYRCPDMVKRIAVPTRVYRCPDILVHVMRVKFNMRLLARINHPGATISAVSNACIALSIEVAK